MKQKPKCPQTLEQGAEVAGWAYCPSARLSCRQMLPKATPTTNRPSSAVLCPGPLK